VSIIRTPYLYKKIHSKVVRESAEKRLKIIFAKHHEVSNPQIKMSNRLKILFISNISFDIHDIPTIEMLKI